jgi:hypothetical protein
MKIVQFSDSSAFAYESELVDVIFFESVAHLRDFARVRVATGASEWEPLADGNTKYHAVFFGELEDCLALHARLLVECPDLGLQPNPLVLSEENPKENCQPEDRAGS